MCEGRVRDIRVSVRPVSGVRVCQGVLGGCQSALQSGGVVR